MTSTPHCDSVCSRTCHHISLVLALTQGRQTTERIVTELKSRVEVAGLFIFGQCLQDFFNHRLTYTKYLPLRKWRQALALCSSDDIPRIASNEIHALHPYDNYYVSYLHVAGRDFPHNLNPNLLNLDIVWRCGTVVDSTPLARGWSRACCGSAVACMWLPFEPPSSLACPESLPYRRVSASTSYNSTTLSPIQPLRSPASSLLTTAGQARCRNLN